MNFADIIEEISQLYPIDLISHFQDWNIQDVALIDTINLCYSKNTLYFGYNTQVENSSYFPPQCILAVRERDTSSSDVSASLDGHSGYNIALVQEDALFSIFNHVKTFIESSRSRGLFDELSRLADDTHSLDAVLNIAAIRLGNSLIFNDMTYKIVASSTSIPVADPLWKENIRQGYCSYDFISAVKQLPPLKNAAQTTTAIEVTCPESPYRKLSSKVFHNGVQIGFVLMIEGETALVPSHREMLSTVSLALTYTISRYVPDLFQGPGPYQQLLYDMLIGAPPSDILPRLNGMDFPSLMTAAYIRPAQYLGQQHLQDHTARHLKLQFPGSHMTSHRGGIAAVLPLEQEPGLSPELLDALQGFAEKERIRIGLSNTFHNMERFTNYFDQAYQALELGSKFDASKTLCCYIDYQLYALFSEMKEPENLGRYCHPALSRLRQYDHKNHTALYETLCVYLETGCSIKMTSERLYIHRNSLVYRLNRITEVCRLNLDDSYIRLLLRVSYLIDKYNGLYS